jgi:NAD-dependent dihydropyrimidine dehydrogenase PreA subunit
MTNSPPANENQQAQAKKLWHGVDRSKLTWFPTIDQNVCTGCGLCVLTCSNSVFKWNVDEKRPITANPQNCVLGCTTCGKVCPEEAITFPDNPSVFIRNVVVKYKVYPKVKEDLEARLAKFPDHVVNSKGEA